MQALHFALPSMVDGKNTTPLRLDLPTRGRPP
jgi:hypothetical protein